MDDFEDIWGDQEGEEETPPVEWDDSLPDFADVQFDEIVFPDSAVFDDFEVSQFEEFDFSPFDEFDVFSDPFAEDEPLPFHDLDAFVSEGDLRGPFPSYDDAVEYAGALNFSQWRILYDNVQDIWYVEIVISA